MSYSFSIELMVVKCTESTEYFQIAVTKILIEVNEVLNYLQERFRISFWVTYKFYLAKLANLV